MLIHTRNTLSEQARRSSVDLLNRHLASSIDLYQQVKQAHWNVRGPTFIAVHELLDAVAAAVTTLTDTIAERAGALGGTAYGTIQGAAERSTLIPYPLGIADEVQHVAAVSGALAAYADGTRQAIDIADQAGDAATADLFTQVTREVDQLLWKLESHLYRG